MAESVPASLLHVGISVFPISIKCGDVVRAGYPSIALTVFPVSVETPSAVAVPVSCVTIGCHVYPVASVATPDAVRNVMECVQVGLTVLPVTVLATMRNYDTLRDLQPNSGNPVLLRLGWLTDILTARSSVEQRRQLRILPAGSMTWEVRSFEVESGGMASLLFGGQGSPLAIPLWPFGRLLSAGVDAGDTTIPLEPGSGTFWVGTQAAFIREGQVSEVRDVSLIAADELELAEPLDYAWPAGTEVYPVVDGYLKAQQPMSWESRQASATLLTVDIPTFGAIERTYPQVPSWLGVEVLEVMPNRSGSVVDDFDRASFVQESRTGAPWVEALTAESRLQRSFVWTALGAAEVLQMLRFLETRRGAANPFWVPTWQQDLSLYTSAVSTDGSMIRIRECNYTDGQFAHGLNRRNIAVRLHGGTSWSYHVVTASENLGDYEELTIIPPVPASWPKETTLVSFLRLCRLENDEVELTCHNPGVVEASIPMIELVGEVPGDLPSWGARARITQEAVEVLRTGRGLARVTQEAVEVLRTGMGSARVSQVAIEVLRTS